MQRRDHHLRILGAQHLQRDVLDQQQLQPVQQLGGRGLLLEARHLAHVVEQVQRLPHQLALDVRVMCGNDLLHRLLVRESDVMEEAAAQECVRQFLLVVRGDDDDRPALGDDGLLGLVDEEFHAVEFLQQVVGELDIRLVDLVDQQHDRRIGREGVPQFAALDVVADVVDLVIAKLPVAQARDRVIFVEALRRLGGRLDVPLDQRQPQRPCHFLRQHRLAGPRLPLHQQRPLQRDRGIDRDLQVTGRDIAVGGCET